MIERALTTAAAVSYTANCALGVGVATGRIRTGRAHWVHHALYICTATLTGGSVLALLVRRRRAGVVLAPALVPLAAIPFAGTRGSRHPAIAVSIAPFLAGALLRVWRTPRRREEIR